MTQEEIFDILAQVHENPPLWLSNLYPFDNHQLSMFASGCEILLLNGLRAEQIRSVVDQNPHVLEALLGGQFDKALRIAKALASGRIYNYLDSYEEEPEASWLQTA